LALNQLIAHHGIIFKPEQRLVWVSANPYQLGEFVAYDLRAIFSGTGPTAGKSMSVDSLLIPADPFLNTEAYQNLVYYRLWMQAMKKALNNDEKVFESTEIDRNLALNPYYYHGYQLAGSYFLKHNEPQKAEVYFRKALALKIPTLAERQKIESLLPATTAK
jgi:hypothetical protein